MSIDLERELTDLARSVHDDGVTERMSGQVRQMVGRIRRRRAARHSATGVIGVGAVAAVAVAGLQLADRYPGPVPPAATDPTATPVPTVGCGSLFPESPAEGDATFDLVGEAGPTAAYGEAVPVSLTLVSANSQTFSVEERVQLLVLADDVVVGIAEADPAEIGVVSGVDPLAGAAVAVTACGGDTPVDSGEYQMLAFVTVELSDGTARTVISDPLPFAITEAAPEEASVDAASTIAGWLASPVENPGLAFPVCGTRASDALDDGMPPLELDLVEPDLTLASGSTYQATVQLHTTEGRYVIGNASPTATLVVLRDGIVVGYQWLDPEDVILAGLSDGQTMEFPVLGTMNLCGTGEGGSGPLVPLPAGEYRIMAALDVMLKEIGEPGAEAEAITALMTAVSEAGRLTVIEP